MLRKFKIFDIIRYWFKFQPIIDEICIHVILGKVRINFILFGFLIFVRMGVCTGKLKPPLERKMLKAISINVRLITSNQSQYQSRLKEAFILYNEL